MKKKVRGLLFVILAMFVLTPCFAYDTEWITSPTEGSTATLQIGESISASNYYASLDFWLDKFELVYTGCEGEIVHFLYREYTANSSSDGFMIRDAYSVTLTFDLAKGKTVGYLDLRMEIIEYDNTIIKIKIIKHLSK